MSGSVDEDRYQRQEHERQHDAEHHADAHWPRDVKAADVPDRCDLYQGLFSLLHLIAKDAFDHFRIGAFPPAEIVHCERVFDGREFLVFLI